MAAIQQQSDIMSSSPMTTPARPAAPARGVGRHRPRKSSNPAGYGLGQAPPAPPTNVARRGSPEILIPPTGAPIVITSPAIVNTFSAWTTIGTPANDLYLSQLWVLATKILLYDALCEFGYGATPTPIDAVRTTTGTTDPTADSTGAFPLGQPAQPAKVPGGQALKARVLSIQQSSVPFHVMALGFDSAYPVWDELPSSLVAGPGRYYPSNTNNIGVLVTPGAWGTWGAAVQVVAAAPNDLLVAHLGQAALPANLAGTAWIVQVGYGPAGAEVWCSTHMLGRLNAAVPIFPPVWVKAGERLAIRAQGAQLAAKGVMVKVYDR